jgi:hypothetical protein
MKGNDKDLNMQTNKGLNTSFRLNPESLSRFIGNLHVYSILANLGNTTPAGVEQPVIIRFYKHLMPLASETVNIRA